MASDKNADPKVKLAASHAKLVKWLRGSAYPLWAVHGIDAKNGGFVETLDQSGTGLAHPRRARVHPRQIYAFAQASRLGWTGEVSALIERGIGYFETHYRRQDGLFRTLAGVDGEPLEDRAVLYDQAFALLGYAAAGEALDARPQFESRALDLRRAIERRFAAGEGAFHSAEKEGYFESNPHMHLLEACLGWAEIGTDSGWAQWAHRLTDLALNRFIRPDSGALGEYFSADWRPAHGVPGRLVEPGHQFEWAWLLLRSENRHPGPVRQAALRLIDIGERSGVYNEVAINALLDDLSIHDPDARFWPQTERLKAALFAAKATGDERYWAMAASAAASFFPYLDTPVAGLWLDVRLPNGELVDSPAPASTFYHLVGAIVALNETMASI